MSFLLNCIQQNPYQCEIILPISMLIHLVRLAPVIKTSSASLMGCSQHADVSAYKSGSREGQHGHGLSRLTAISGKEGQPIWSHKTAIIEKPIAEKHCTLAEGPCYPSASKSVYKGHMRTGPLSNGRWWPGLINQIFFYLLG